MSLLTLVERSLLAVRLLRTIWYALIPYIKGTVTVVLQSKLTFWFALLAILVSLKNVCELMSSLSVCGREKPIWAMNKLAVSFCSMFLLTLKRMLYSKIKRNSCNFEKRLCLFV
jgi:hypothetical protein